MTTFWKVVTHSVTSLNVLNALLGIRSLGDWRSCAYLISFSQRLDSDIQLRTCSIKFVHSTKNASVIMYMYECLTVSMAGCLCLFPGSSKWNVCRSRNTLVVTKLCKYTSAYLQHVDVIGIIFFVLVPILYWWTYWWGHVSLTIGVSLTLMWLLCHSHVALCICLVPYDGYPH